MKRAISLIQSDDVAIRSLLVDGTPWYIAADVCRALNIATPGPLSDDEMQLVCVVTPTGPRAVTVVSETGVNSLCAHSPKPDAVLSMLKAVEA